jgi:hypothetical protein
MLSGNSGCALATLFTSTCDGSDRGPSAGDEVDDEDHHRHYQQKVYQASSNVKAPAQKPQDQENRENRPKHANHPARKSRQKVRSWAGGGSCPYISAEADAIAAGRIPSAFGRAWFYRCQAVWRHEDGHHACGGRRRVSHLFPNRREARSRCGRRGTLRSAG